MDTMPRISSPEPFSSVTVRRKVNASSPGARMRHRTTIAAFSSGCSATNFSTDSSTRDE